MGSSGYGTRSPKTDDASAIAGLIAACDRHEGAETSFGVADLLEQWEQSDFDLDRDAWVVTDAGGRVVGYAELTNESEDFTHLEEFGLVHPEHRGRGVGSGMVDAVEARARSLASGAPEGAVPRLWAFVSAADPLGLDLLKARGFREGRQYWHMKIALDSRRFTPWAPDGVVVRPYEERDLRGLYELMQEGFSDHWGFTPQTFDDWAAFMRRDDFDPGLCFVAEVDGRLVGGATSSRPGGQPFVRDLAVLKPWRGRGIASALLEHTFAAFASRSGSSVMLNVDSSNETGAVALYERVGMETARRFVGLQKPL